MIHLLIYKQQTRDIIPGQDNQTAENRGPLPEHHGLAQPEI